jgi:ABC-2 type transport system permease protein
MNRIAALFTVSFGQALPRRRSIMLALLELAPALIYVFATNSRTSEAAFQGVIEIGASTFLALVLPVVTIVVSAGALGNERRDMTLSFIALRPLPRSVIATTKIAAAISAAFALNAIGALALGLTHLVRFGGVSVVIGMLCAALIATVAYAAVFVPLGFLTDRAVIIGMAYLLVFENGVIFALSGLALVSPWRLGASVLAGMVDGASIYLVDAVGTTTLARALATAVVYFILGVLLSTWLLRRRDLA